AGHIDVDRNRRCTPGNLHGHGRRTVDREVVTAEGNICDRASGLVVNGDVMGARLHGFDMSLVVSQHAGSPLRPLLVLRSKRVGPGHSETVDVLTVCADEIRVDLPDRHASYFEVVGLRIARYEPVLVPTAAVDVPTVDDRDVTLVLVQRGHPRLV